jgi:hypothetical protein
MTGKAILVIARRLLLLAMFVQFVPAALAQETALPVDRNSPEVRRAQRECVEKMKAQLLKEKVRATAWGAEEEAFTRCKEITGWQSPQ